jgi:hypothetical protein
MSLLYYPYCRRPGTDNGFERLEDLENEKSDNYWNFPGGFCDRRSGVRVSGIAGQAFSEGDW